MNSKSRVLYVVCLVFLLLFVPQICIGKPTSEQLEKAVIGALDTNLVIIKPISVEYKGGTWVAVSRSFEMRDVTVSFEVIKPFNKWIDKAYAAQLNQFEKEIKLFDEKAKANYKDMAGRVKKHYENIFGISNLEILQPGYLAKMRIPKLKILVDGKENQLKVNKRSLRLFDQHVLALLRKIEKVDGKINEIPSLNEMMIERGSYLYHFGLDDVPGCFSCHGEKGEGSTRLKVLSVKNKSRGQLLQALEDFAANRRRDEIMYVMNFNASSLTAYDRQAGAAYMSTLSGVGAGANPKINAATLFA